MILAIALCLFADAGAATEHAQATAERAQDTSTTAVWLAAISMVAGIAATVASIFTNRDKLKYDNKIAKLEMKTEKCEEDHKATKEALESCHESHEESNVKIGHLVTLHQANASRLSELESIVKRDK